jgi:hypothetical protein
VKPWITWIEGWTPIEKGVEFDKNKYNEIASLLMSP